MAARWASVVDAAAATVRAFSISRSVSATWCCLSSALGEWWPSMLARGMVRLIFCARAAATQAADK